MLISFNILTEKDELYFLEIHDLKTIVNSTAVLIDEFKKSENDSETAKEFINCINVVKNFIMILYNKTDDMTFARYPLKTKKKDIKSQFYIAEMENVVIDMEILLEQIAVVYKCLEYIYDRCDGYIQYLNEIEAENREN